MGNSSLKLAAVVMVGVALPGSATSAPLTGTGWTPIELLGNAFMASENTEAYLRFLQEDVYVGTVGCNMFRGRVVTDAGSILFAPGPTTRMACPGAVGEQEAAMMRSLMAARFFEQEGQVLVLHDADGAVLIRLRQSNED